MSPLLGFAGRVGRVGRGGRPRRPGVTAAPGEHVLAQADVDDGRTAAGTRDAFYVGAGDRIDLRLPWEQVETAEWDAETTTLRVAEVGSWGAPRVEQRLMLSDPARLLQLVRERVTASIVLQRPVPITPRRGLRVVARRAPGTHGPLSWVFEYDEGVDPDDPVVRLAAERALLAAQADVGLT